MVGEGEGEGGGINLHGQTVTAHTTHTLGAQVDICAGESFNEKDSQWDDNFFFCPLENQWFENTIMDMK